MSENTILIKEYAKVPLNNFVIDNCDVSYHEWNFICGDDITVYLSIKDQYIIKYWYTGNTSMTSLASASYLSEFIMNAFIQDVLNRNYQTLLDREFLVSSRRKRAALLPILAVRNALHEYIKDWIVDDFDDLLD